MTRAQLAARAKQPLPILRCTAKLGSDRCTRQEKHHGMHETIGPTGVRLRWSVVLTFKPARRR